MTTTMKRVDPADALDSVRTIEHATIESVSLETHGMPGTEIFRALPWCIICDIDGTVALNDGHRDFFDWSLVGNDKPNERVCELVRELMEWTEVIFMSGRMRECYGDTQDWIGRHIAKHQWPGSNGGRRTSNDWRALPTANKLFMRADGDRRPDNIVKRELYDEHIDGKYRVRFVLDDRNSVVRMWRAMGLTCLQVADGDF